MKSHAVLHGGDDVFYTGMSFGVPRQQGAGLGFNIQGRAACPRVTHPVGNVDGKHEFHSAFSLRLQTRQPMPLEGRD